jgi:hypothetical protein
MKMGRNKLENGIKINCMELPREKGLVEAATGGSITKVREKGTVQISGHLEQFTMGST